MYTPFDPDERAAAAAQMNHQALHDLLDPVRDAGLLSAGGCDAICDEFGALLQLILDRSIPDARFWPLFQQAFGFSRTSEPILSPIVPMNAANLCPEPSALINAANRLRSEYNDNVAQQTRTKRGVRVVQLEQVRRYLSASLGLCDFNDLALIRNSSEGNNAIAAGYRGWKSKPGERENVVLWTENHPTNAYSWNLRAKWGGGDRFEIREVSWDPNDNDETIAKAFCDRIDEHTRFVSYTVTSNSSGTRVPDTVIHEIWTHAIAANPACHVHLDGTMAWGAEAVNLSQPHCHSFVSSAHKWFLGPKETAIFYMAPDKAVDFAPSIYAYDYAINIPPWPDMPKNAQRFALLGQRDDVNVIILGLTQMMWTALAVREPFARVRTLAQGLKNELRKHGWELVTPHAASRSGGIVRVKAPYDPKSGRESLYDWVYRDARFGAAGDERNQTLRVCPHVYNTDADMARLIESMNAWRDAGCRGT